MSTTLKFLAWSIFFIMGAIALKNMLLETVYAWRELRRLNERARKRKEAYVHHVCDRSGDGMCVQCQLNAVRALLL